MRRLKPVEYELWSWTCTSKETYTTERLLVEVEGNVLGLPLNHLEDLCIA